MSDAGRNKLGSPVPRWQIVVLCAGPALLLAFALLLLFVPSVPLGVPGEWAWERYSQMDFPVFEMISAFFVFAVMLALGYLTDFERQIGRYATRILPVVVVLAGSWIDYQILLSGKIGMAENVSAVLDRHTTGYLTEAAGIKSFRDYFGSFHVRQDLREGHRIEHVDTHPPGNVLISYAVLEACRKISGLTPWVLEHLPNDVSMVFRQADRYDYFRPLPREPAVYAAAYVLLLLMMMALAAARVLLLFAAVAARGTARHTGAGIAACSLVAIPAPILFVGHFDVFFFFLTSLVMALFVMSRAPACSTLRAGLLLAVTGFVCGLGVVCTLGYGVVILFVTAFFLLRFPRQKDAWKELLCFMAGGGATILLCRCFGIRIVEICFSCMRNNSQFHLDTMRSWRWILVNPAELVFFLGGLWVTVAFLGLYRSPLREIFDADDIERMRILGWVFLVYLVVHPYCRGEFARLALLFLPILMYVCVHDLVKWAGRDRTSWALAAGGAGAALVQVMLMRCALKLAFFCRTGADLLE